MHLLSVIFLMLLFIAYRITMVWKFIILTFCLIKSWSHDQSKWVHKHFPQLAERMRLSDRYDNLHTVFKIL